ncbi:MAG: hypothetical protein RDV48_29015 [Candidatus Eremiobacteraeota bacterium]|nr:hypothetical protein [Candidatus Eremiobacteraeota bacterium]
MHFVHIPHAYTAEEQRRLGYVADFCPYCRGLRCFSFVEINLVTRFMLIPTRKEFVREEIKCSACKIRLLSEKKRYTAIEKKPLPPVKLMEKTLPGFNNEFAHRLALEETLELEPHSLPCETRQFFIREIFNVLSPDLDFRCSTCCIDLPVAIALTGIFALPFLTYLKLADLVSSEVLDGATAISALACLGALVIVIRGEPRRYLRRVLLPKLVKGLRVIEPLREELVTCLEHMAREHPDYAKLFRDREIDLLLNGLDEWYQSN